MATNNECESIVDSNIHNFNLETETSLKIPLTLEEYKKCLHLMSNLEIQSCIKTCYNINNEFHNIIKSHALHCVSCFNIVELFTKHKQIHFRTLYFAQTGQFTFEFKCNCSYINVYSPYNNDLFCGFKKNAVEFVITCHNLQSMCLSVAKYNFKIIRHFIIDIHNTRIAIERKVAQNYMDELCHLHFENETNNKGLKIIEMYREYDFLKSIFDTCCHLNRNYNIVECTDVFNHIRHLKVTRQYQEVCIDSLHDKSLQISRKIDGKRYLLLMTHDAWFILNGPLSHVYGKHSLKFHFNYLCYVEYINNIFYIIDCLYQIYLDNDNEFKYIKISNLAAVNFINNLPINDNINSSLCKKYVLSKNVFVSHKISKNDDISRLNTLFVESDGFILVAPDCIYKLKNKSTIDLYISLKNWLKHIVKVQKKNIPESLLEKINLYCRNNKPIVFDKQDFIFLNEKCIPYLKNMFQLYNSITGKYENFSQHFNNNIVLPPSLSCETFWSGQGYNSSIVVNFQIVEFNVDYSRNNKSLIYNTIRNKPSCNTLNYIECILSK